MTLRNPSVPLPIPVSPIDNRSPFCGAAEVKKDEDGNGSEAELEKAVEEAQEELEVEDEEIRKPRIGRRPVLLTKAEIDSHFPLHLNYRSWRKHCVLLAKRDLRNTGRPRPTEND